MLIRSADFADPWGLIMRRFRPAALAAVAVVGVASVASAADLPVKAPVAPVAPVAVAPSWTGFYIGGEVGGRWSNSTWTTYALVVPNGPISNRTGDIPASFSGSSVRAGGYLGYNWQVAPAWVLGIEGDVAWSKNNKSRPGVPGTWTPPFFAQVANDNSSVNLGWDAAIRGRLGWLVAPSVMLFGAGGVAWQDVSINANCQVTGPWCSVPHNTTFNTVKMGWTVGGGVEAKIWSNLLARIEYRYADFGRTDYQFLSVPTSNDTVFMHHDLKTQIVSVGLAYQFGGPGR